LVKSSHSARNTRIRKSSDSARDLRAATYVSACLDTSFTTSVLTTCYEQELDADGNRLPCYAGGWRCERGSLGIADEHKLSYVEVTCASPLEDIWCEVTHRQSQIDQTYSCNATCAPLMEDDFSIEDCMPPAYFPDMETSVVCCARYPSAWRCRTMTVESCIDILSGTMGQAEDVRLCHRYCEEAAQKPDWCPVRPSRTPTPSSSPRAYRLTQLINRLDSTTEPLLLQPTTGEVITIEPTGPGFLKLAEVAIESGANIQARRLRVSSHLALSGGSKLAPVQDDLITITTQTRIAMAAEEQRLPQLDLGAIGTQYALVPAEILVEISSNGLGTSSHELIRGATLDNCEDWKKKLTILGPNQFEAVCISERAGGRRILAAEVTSLVIRGSFGGGEPEKIPIIPIVAGVVGGVVVLAAVGIGIFIWLRKRKAQIEPDSPSVPTPLSAK
jgi:hypothetical protein